MKIPIGVMKRTVVDEITRLHKLQVALEFADDNSDEEFFTPFEIKLELNDVMSKIKRLTACLDVIEHKERNPN